MGRVRNLYIVHQLLIMASAAKIGRQFDFSAIGKRVGSELRGDVSRLAATHASLKDSLTKIAEQPAKIDWAFYKSHITTPGLVASAEKAYSAIQYPKPVDTKSGPLSSRRADMAKQAEAAAVDAEARLKELEKQLAALKAEKDVATVTIDEALAANPEFAREVQQNIKSGKWVP
eukprot:CFRG8338T1